MTPEALIIKLNQAITPAQQAEYLAPGATDEQIQAFREALGPISERLPESFYAFYRWHNGSAPGKYDIVPFHNGRPLLSLEHIASCWRKWNELAEEGYFSEYVAGAWWDSAWIPYIETYSHIQVIDTKGSFGGQAGQIIDFDYKSASDREILYASFDHWLAWILALIEVDLWRPGELSDEPSSAQDKRDLTFAQSQRADKIIKTFNPRYPWTAELHRYRKAALENPPNPHWASLKEAIKSDDLTGVQRLIEEKQIALSEQNAHERDNFTPLHLAAHNCAWESALWLMKQGADLKIKDAYGSTPLDRLINNFRSRFGRQDIVRQILAIFDAASERAHPLPVEDLVDAAIKENNSQFLAYALQHGCSPNTIPRARSQPLLHQTVEQGWFAGYEQLRRAGADLAQLDKDGLTVSEYIEKQLAQRLAALLDSPHDQRQKQKLIGLVEFFRAEGRLDNFLAQLYRHAEAQFGLPLDNDERYDGLSAIADVLQRIDPALAIPVSWDDADTLVDLLENERYGEMLDLLDKRIGVQYSPDVLYLACCALHALKRNNEAQVQQLLQIIRENMGVLLSEVGALCIVVRDEFRNARFNAITLQVLECVPLTFDADNMSLEQEYLRARCEILQQRGRYDEVLTLTEQYLTMRQGADTWQLRGKLLERLQRFPEALNCYLRALEIGTRDDFGHQMTRRDVIQLASQLNQTALARKHYELIDEEYLTPRFEQAEKDSKVFWLRQKMDYLAYFDLPAAEKAYQQLLQDDSYSDSSDATRYYFGKMLRRAGKPEAEILLWQEHLSQQPEDIDAREQMAWLLHLNGQYEEAIVNFQQALEWCATTSIWWGLGDSQRRLGLSEQSIDSLQQALTGYKENSDEQMEIRLDLAFAYHANQQAEGALAIAEPARHHWQQQAEQYPGDPQTLEQWLRACVALRKPEATLAALKTLLLLNPEKRQAHLEWLWHDAEMQFVREQKACREVLVNLEEVSDGKIHGWR